MPSIRQALPMPPRTVRAAYLQGLGAGAPFVLVIVPFAVLFGVVATEAGWNLAEVMGMSILVIAGAAQFTAVQLMTENAPTIVVILAALAVNLRMALYSAALAPHLGAAPVWQRALAAYMLVDQVYGLSVQRYETDRSLGLRERVAFLFGAATPAVPLWYLFSYVGAVAGQAIPEGLALDFALPITFIAMIAPMLPSLPHLVAAATSVAVALALIALPWSLGLMVAAGAAMGAGALTELALDRLRR